MKTEFYKDIRRFTIYYSNHGHIIRKPTDIWTNIPIMKDYFNDEKFIPREGLETFKQIKSIRKTLNDKYDKNSKLMTIREQKHTIPQGVCKYIFDGLINHLENL